MQTTPETLIRKRYSHKSTTHDSDVVRLRFAVGPALSIWRHDPNLADLRPGADLVLAQQSIRHISGRVTETVYEILHIKPIAPTQI